MNALLEIQLQTSAPDVDTTPQIARARAGDAGAFADLYQQHYRRVYALCLRMTADAGRAEDLTQDTFVQAWRNLGSYQGDAQFSTWLHRIAVNTVLTQGRRRGRWFDWLKTMPEASQELVSAADQPESMLDLESAISRLPERARQVFVLVDIEGYTHREAAETLKMAVGTSKAHLFHARSLLKEILS